MAQSSDRNTWTGSERAPEVHWSRHIEERCAERLIAARDVRRILEHPFVSGQEAESGVRWHVGPARCGRSANWHWIKVIESNRDGHPTLITSYALRRRRRRRGK